MNTTGPLDCLEDDDYRLVEATQGELFKRLVFDCGGDEAKANDLFTRMVADAFADHLIFAPDPDDPLPGESDPAKVVAMVNAKLVQDGARWRITAVKTGDD
jgi:hypothetical protein